MSEDKVYSGSVVWFSKGYGFLLCNEDEKEYFVHYSDITSDGFKTLKKGQKVSFSLGLNHRQQPKAINVVALKE